MTVPPAPRSKRHWIRAIFSVLACAGILAASVGAVVIIQRTEPTAQTINAKRKSAALVETISVQRGTYQPKIEVLGTVGAAQEINLSPRISGQVAEISSRFLPGGMVERGSVLLQIDPADFENALSIRRSELDQVQASLDIEAGRQSLAKKELDLLQGTISASNKSLVMREPQLASIRAEIEAAEAEVERAQLDLDRSVLVAPFDAIVLTRTVNVGSQVSPGDELGRLVGTDEYWISAAVPVRSLRWIQFADMRNTAESSAVGSSVTLRDEDAWGPDAHRKARVSRMIGTLDNQTRLAQVLIAVSDPLSSTDSLPGPAVLPPLILGALIDVEIEGRPIGDVVRLPRDYLRDGDTVWVMEGDELRIRNVEVTFRDAQFAYVQEGLDDGDEVITTTLATVTDGVGLRKIDAASTDDDSSETSSDVAEMASEQ